MKKGFKQEMSKDIKKRALDKKKGGVTAVGSGKSRYSGERYKMC